MVEIKKVILDKLIEWNQPPYNASERIDKKIVATLLVTCVGGEKLAQHEIDPDAMYLIQSKCVHYIVSMSFFLQMFYSLSQK